MEEVNNGTMEKTAPPPYSAVDANSPVGVNVPPEQVPPPAQAPPPQGYAPQPQGYAPQPQGYPPLPEGYPPQPQGYVPQPQGYAPQPHGYVTSTQPQGYALVPNQPPPNQPQGARVIISAAEFGPHPQPLKCPSCHEQITTRVEHAAGTKTHIFAAVFCGVCMFTCLPLCCIPYCIKSCKDQTHYCPSCGAYLGKYDNNIKF